MGAMLPVALLLGRAMDKPTEVTPEVARFRTGLGRMSAGATVLGLLFLNLAGCVHNDRYNTCVYHGWPAPAVMRVCDGPGPGILVVTAPGQFAPYRSMTWVERFAFHAGEARFLPAGCVVDLFVQVAIVYFAYRAAFVLATINGWTQFRVRFSMTALFVLMALATVGFAWHKIPMWGLDTLTVCLWITMLVLIPLTWLAAENLHRFDRFV
jgi:hypothetical protein